MSQLNPYERVFIHTLLPIHFLSLAAALLFLFIVRSRSEKGPVKQTFLMVHIMIILWLVGKILKTVAPMLFMRWSFNVLYYMGILPIGPGFFLFSMAILGKRVGHRIKIMLFMPSLLMFFIVLTNPLHHLFYSRYTFFKDSFGPLFYLHFIITYIFMLVSIIFLFRGAFRYRKMKLKPTFLVLGALLPLLVNLNYILDWIDPMFDITPIVYNVSMIILGIAGFSFDFFNFVPETVVTALNSLPGAVVIGEEVFGANPDTPFGMYRLHCYQINRRGSEIAVKRYFNSEEIVKKTSRLKEISRMTSEKHKELEREVRKRNTLIERRERIRMAGEIHDILGHSLTTIICLLENSRYNKQEGDELIRTENVIRSIISRAVSELENQNQVDLKLPWRQKFLRLPGEIELHGLECELLWDQRLNLYDDYFELFYKIALECCTNTLRYGSATKMTIIVQSISDRVMLIVLDNGMGCSGIIEGTGLSNMRRRVREWDGEIHFYSEPGSGFQVSLKLKGEKINSLSPQSTSC